MDVMPELVWVPGPFDARVDEVLESWVGTPYMLGQRAKGRAVDCVNFVLGVLDELYGWEPRLVKTIPGDVSMHDPQRAFKALKEILELYPGGSVSDGTVQAGDVAWVSPVGGGPGHGLIASSRPGVFYEIRGLGYRVSASSPNYSPGRQSAPHILRPEGKETWV